jgi:glycerophosphoryl diester phosphodiesterase
MFLKRKNNTGLLCFGHRGAMGYEPENTLISFSKALELGVPWIELDLHMLEDQLVVIHDKPAVQSFKELRGIDLGKQQKVPLLEEVFQLVNKKAGINIPLLV